jgi:outer membrane protein OmpA-like peptidoglycan-associated protein
MGMGARKAIIFVLACGLVLASVGRLEAQTKDVVDLTEREDLTSEDIVRGLVRQKMRGIAPTPSHLPTVAITVRFAFNSAAILPEATQNLRSVGTALLSPELAPNRIQIEGHTDSIGSDQYNVRLSERRANSVKQYLMKHFRIAPERLVSLGKGETEPITENETPEGRGKNRRVELVNLGTN